MPRVVFVEPTGNAVGSQFNNYSTSSTYYTPQYHDNHFIPQDVYPYPQQDYYSQQDYYAPPVVVQQPSDLPEIAIDVARLSPEHSPVQEKAEILKEIVRECEAIERRNSPSSTGSSPLYPWLSSDDEEETTDSPGPYRNPVKKERKKAQNRLAATRYREKKRKEKEERQNTISELLSRNEDLKKQVSSVESEVNVLKKLMIEMGVHF